MSEDKNKSVPQDTKKQDEDTSVSKPENNAIGGNLIGGGGLLQLLQSIIPMLSGMDHHETVEIDNDNDSDDDLEDQDSNVFLNEEDGDSPCFDMNNPFEVLEDDDFDSKDPVVDTFKNDLGGTKGMVKIISIGPAASEKIAEIIEKLHNIRMANRLVGLRTAYSLIHKAKRGEGARYQAQAVQLLSRLSSDSIDASERLALVKAEKAILTGDDNHLDAAAYRVHEVFSGNVGHDNIRVAYLENPRGQSDEPYLLCPKARHQVGQALPMPISSCRDNCIDSHTTHEGKVTCAYSNWLKTAADNQVSALARLEEIHSPDNKKNLLTLMPDERYRKENLLEDSRTWELRMEDAVGRGQAVGDNDKNWEARLEDTKQSKNGHKGDKGDNGLELTMEERLRKPTLAQTKSKGINPEKDAPLGGQIEDLRKKNTVPEIQVEEQLDGASEPNLGHHGDPKERVQDVFEKKASKKVTKIDAESDDTIGKQIVKRHETDEDNDSTLEELLSDADLYFDDDEFDILTKTLEELLAQDRKGK